MKPRLHTLRPVEPGHWRARAACAYFDPELWFPGPADNQTVELAKRICEGCPVRIPCRDEAISDYNIVGIWGGTTSSERPRLSGRRVRSGVKVA